MFRCMDPPSSRKRRRVKAILPTQPRQMLSAEMPPASSLGSSNSSTMKFNSRKVSRTSLNHSYRQIHNLRFQVCSVLYSGQRETHSRPFRARPYILWILPLTHRFLEQHRFSMDRRTLQHPGRSRLIHEYQARLPFHCPLVVLLQLLEKCSLVSKCL
jgi:hypothetical protein